VRVAKVLRVGVWVAVVVVGVASLGGCSSSANVSFTPTSSDLSPRGPVITDVPVLRVVDGDTLHVLVAGRDTTVRLLGINTPETVKPNSPVECFGPEASTFAKQALDGQRITLEFDDSQGRLDKYGRTLAYVWLPTASGGLDLINRELVADGYAYQRQYGPSPVAWQSELVDAENQARSQGAGLWGACRS
jgi:micrococcal nuclease